MACSRPFPFARSTSGDFLIVCQGACFAAWLVYHSLLPGTLICSHTLEFCPSPYLYISLSLSLSLSLPLSLSHSLSLSISLSSSISLSLSLYLSFSLSLPRSPLYLSLSLSPIYLSLSHFSLSLSLPRVHEAVLAHHNVPDDFVISVVNCEEKLSPTGFSKTSSAFSLLQ